jgi:hypothetical protein
MPITWPAFLRARWLVFCLSYGLPGVLLGLLFCLFSGLGPGASGASAGTLGVMLAGMAGIPVGVFPNPIMPWITDTHDSLERLAAAAREAGATYFGGGPLFLMPCAQKVFFPFLEQRFPHLAPRYRKLYEKSAYLRGMYKEQLARRIKAIRERYGLGTGPVEYRPEAEPEQLNLF